ncbi:amidohydrolase family protein [Gemmatimonadota bacterium]
MVRKRKNLAITSAVLLLGAIALVLVTPSSDPLNSTLIYNALIVDGSGAPAYTGSVRIEGTKIRAVGQLRQRRRDAIMDAGGRVLAPGFIDSHSHVDRGLFMQREALACVSQGITTVITGQCGGSVFPLREFFDRLDREPAAINIASLAGHGTLRNRVMGDDYRRAATGEEIAAMADLLHKEMQAGALGVSSGLEYDPGIYSTTDEVVALATVAAGYGGRYVSHMRSEDRSLWESVDEIITIGERASIPVHISHMKLAMLSWWGQADRLIKRLDTARANGVEITGDLYPYPYWQSSLTVLFPDRDFENRDSAAFALNEVTPAEGLLMASYGPDSTCVGKTVAEIAEMRSTDPVTTLIDLILDSRREGLSSREGAESVIGTSMSEEDVRELMQWPQAGICTDGTLGSGHPRSFGSFPRVLGRYVREYGVLDLEEAVRKMTSQSASNAGLESRGLIKPGYYADLVLFDPDTVLDQATTDDPRLLSNGIEWVCVNGTLVYFGGVTSGDYPGMVLRRP